MVEIQDLVDAILFLENAPFNQWAKSCGSS